MNYSLKGISTTKDCIDRINDVFKLSKWKRKTKFNLPNGNIARVFTNDETSCTIIVDNRGFGYLYPNLDISLCKETIDKIDKACRSFWTHDYGEVYFNPLTNSVWIVGDDGGIIYIDLPLDTMKKMIQSDEENDTSIIEELFEQEDKLEDQFKKMVPSITTFRDEAEYYPCGAWEGEDYKEMDDEEKKSFDEESGYIAITSINLL